MVRRFGSAQGLLSLVIALGSFGASTAHAHIKLLKPASWLDEDFLGGPEQKVGPCGEGTESNDVTTFMAGETIEVQWDETIAHPGFFRIAVAENRADLKDPDIVTKDMIDGSCNYPLDAVTSTAVAPVLADNLFPTTDYPQTRTGMKAMVTLPTKPCEKCTLQLIQFMREHPQPCIYYHCAYIKIVAGNGSGGAGGAGGATAGAGGATAGASGASAGAGGAGSGTGGTGMMVMSMSGTGGSTSGVPMPPKSGSGGMTGGSGMTGSAGSTAGSAAMPTTPTPTAATSDSGCATSAPAGGASSPLGVLAGLALLGWVRVRRRR